jgi:metal-dependent HD superfamily phosphatase/phosphodiesterase
MEEGRARIPFEAGKVDIHSASALSIKRVEIQEGEEKPINVKITMTNPAGVFQIDELLKPRIEGSGLKAYIHVTAEVVAEKEARTLEKFEI